MAIEVGRIGDPSDLVPLAAVLGQAFVVDPPVTRAWMDRAGVDELRVARGDGEVIGGLLRIPMAQAFGGRFVPMVGIAGVAVRADRRRGGVASELMRQVLLEMWESGTALSALYASNQPLYRSVGYEQAGAHYHGTLRPRDIDVREPDGRVSLATPADRSEIESLYREHALARPGHLDRGPYVWSRLWQPFDNSVVDGALMWDDQGHLESYVLYSQHRREEGFLLTLRDAASRTSRGWRRIWSHLRDITTVVSEIKLSTAPTDPLFVLQPHPYMKVQLHEPWMLRIVDPIVALEARGYPKGQPERLVIRVIDPLLGDQSLTMDVEGGRASVRKGGDPTAKIHVRGLAALYTGHMSPFEAAALGLVEAGERSLAALQSVFAGPAPWMRDFF